METERRGSVILTFEIGQPITGGTNEQKETVRDFKTASYGSLQDGEGQQRS